MTDKPIIFSAPMILRLLAGEKRQTRRAMKLPTKGEYIRPDMGGWAPTINGGEGVFRIGRGGERIPVPETVGIWNQTTGTNLDARHQAGDRLWVREAWRVSIICNDHKPSELQGFETIYYEATERPTTHPTGRLRAAMHMPRRASRITLIVTEVRIQRLQEISDDDAIAEGVTQDGAVAGRDVDIDGGWWPGGPRNRYRELWDRINAERTDGAYAWAQNPWVVATTFTTHCVNIDQMKAAA